MCDDEIAEAIDRNFMSPNESDSNFESANVVDGLFAIARSILELAEAVKPAEVIEVEDQARASVRRAFGDSNEQGEEQQ